MYQETRHYEEFCTASKFKAKLKHLLGTENTYGPQRSKFMPQLVKPFDASVISNPKQVREIWKQHFDEYNHIYATLGPHCTID